MALRIRRDDTVRVIAGKDRGRTGRVKSVDRQNQRVYVEGVNIVKRHIKPHTVRDTQRAQEIGGIVEMEGPIHVSNVMLIDPESGEPTRIGVNRDGGKRVRVARKSGRVTSPTANPIPGICWLVNSPARSLYRPPPNSARGLAGSVSKISNTVPV